MRPTSRRLVDLTARLSSAPDLATAREAGLALAMDAQTLLVALREASRYVLGATDMGPVLALYRPALMETCAKYSTAADVWLRLVYGVTKPGNSRMTRGLRVEPLLREQYRATVGPCSEAPGLLPHPSLSFAAASPDALVGDDGVVEFKTASEFGRASWGEPGSDHIPDAYAVQVQWQLAVTGRKWAHVLVAFGRDFKDGHGADAFAVTEQCVYQCQRDDELCAALAEAAERFWREHVLTETPPNVEPRESKRIWKSITKEATQ